MAGTVFVDTNVLVYSRDASDPGKQARAMDWVSRLWKERAGRLSFQLLAEFYVTVTRKLDPGMDARTAREDVRALLAWKPISTDPGILEGAWRIGDRYGISWWDSLIVSAAEAAECGILLTEDLQDGQALGPLRVVNPFLHAPREVLPL